MKMQGLLLSYVIQELIICYIFIKSFAIVKKWNDEAKELIILELQKLRYLFFLKTEFAINHFKGIEGIFLVLFEFFLVLFLVYSARIYFSN